MKVKLTPEQTEELRHLIFNHTANLDMPQLLLIPMSEWLEKQDFKIL